MQPLVPEVSWYQVQRTRSLRIWRQCGWMLLGLHRKRLKNIRSKMVKKKKKLHLQWSSTNATDPFLALPPSWRGKPAWYELKKLFDGMLFPGTAGGSLLRLLWERPLSIFLLFFPQWENESRHFGYSKNGISTWSVTCIPICLKTQRNKIKTKKCNQWNQKHQGVSVAGPLGRRFCFCSGQVSSPETFCLQSHIC